MAGSWPIFSKAGVFVAHADFADPARFAGDLAAARFGWCAIRAHQGNVETDQFRIPELLAALRAAGIRPGIWGYLETDPESDAALASTLISKYDGPGSDLLYVANAEAEYKSDSGGDRARSARFVSRFRQLRPTRTAALSSYGAATWDNNLSTVFDYAPWQASRFDFMPQAYYGASPELAPGNCVRHALAAGWTVDRVHPTVGVHGRNGADGFRWRLSGADNAYLLRTLATTGYSVYNAENLDDADYAALALLNP